MNCEKLAIPSLSWKNKYICAAPDQWFKLKKISRSCDPTVHVLVQPFPCPPEETEKMSLLEIRTFSGIQNEKTKKNKLFF